MGIRGEAALLQLDGHYFRLVLIQLVRPTIYFSPLGVLLLYLILLYFDLKALQVLL